MTNGGAAALNDATVIYLAARRAIYWEFGVFMMELHAHEYVTPFLRGCDFVASHYAPPNAHSGRSSDRSLARAPIPVLTSIIGEARGFGRG